MCYKPFMRKWMRERLLRRKKKPDDTKDQAGSAPLQLAYFDAEPPTGPSSVAEIHETEPAAEEPQSVTSEQPARPQSGRSSAPINRRRRRRGRGGQRGKSPATGSAAKEQAASEETPGATETPESPQSVSTPRPPKGTVVLAIGLPGSGKSSWFKRHNINPLSSDMLRALLFDDANEQRFQDLIFSNLRSMLKARLIARRPLSYVDATNLTPQDRHSWLKLAKDYGYEVQAVFFDVPLEVCLERNRRRERAVAEDVMQRFAAKLKPPTFEEGFTKITVVRVKQKE